MAGKGNGTKPKGARKKLTPKRQMFVEALIPANGNASEAARRAGLKHPGQQGHRLLKDVEIQQAVKERLEEALDCMGADEVLRELTAIARADWERIKLGDKLKALELLGKTHKLFIDNLVISGKVSLLDAIRGATDDG